MNKEKLVKIINKELTTLGEIVGDFSSDGSIDSFELDLALSKVKDIQHVLLLLKNDFIDHKTTDEAMVVPKSQSPELQKIKVEEVVPHKKMNSDESQIPVIELPIETEPVILIKEPELLIPDAPIAEQIRINEPLSDTTKNKIIEEELKPQLEVPEPKIQEIVADPIPPKPQLIVDTITSNPKTNPNESEVSAKSTGSIIADKYINQTSSVNDMLAGIHKSKDLASTIKDKPIRNLKSAIKLNDRIWFTNELFQKESALFDKTVDYLNQASDLDEALAYLFSNFNWDQNQKSTIHFLELVFRRFTK